MQFYAMHNAFCPIDDRETTLTDLLTDLMHYAAAERLSFGKCLKRAHGHYLNEKKETEE